MSLRANFTFRRGDFELAVDLQLPPGIIALFGPSGSGKTTLLHVLAGLLRPQEGSLHLQDRCLSDADKGLFVQPHQRRVGLLFQDLRLFPHLSAGDNLLFGHRLAGAGREGPAPKEVVEALELGPLLQRQPAHLSGGERQRVALGRALLASPGLLLMDEPLAALDLQLRRQILPYLRWVQERWQIPIVYVSHSLPEILDLTEQMVVLGQGKVCGHGEVFDVLGQTLHGEQVEPFSTASLLKVVVGFSHEEGDYVRAVVGEQELTLPFKALSPGYAGKVAVGPDDVMLALQPLSGVSARNQLKGTVVRLSPLHGRQLVHVQIAEDAVIRAELTQNAIDDLGIQIGGQVVCVVKTSSFRWL